MSHIYTSADQLIGKTPLLELTHIEKKFDLKAKILAKLEYFNPAGSVKDRVARAMIDDAEAKGLLKEGSVIIEPTSGNTILDGTGRVEVLQLGQNVSRQLLLLFNVGELQQRGVTDQLVSGSIDLAHNKFPPDTDTTSRTGPGTRGAARNYKPLNQHCLWV